MSKRTIFNPFLDSDGSQPQGESDHATARSVTDYFGQELESQRIAIEQTQRHWGQGVPGLLPEIGAEGSVLSNPRYRNRKDFQT